MQTQLNQEEKKKQGGEEEKKREEERSVENGKQQDNEDDGKEETTTTSSTPRPRPVMSKRVSIKGFTPTSSSSPIFDGLTVSKKTSTEKKYKERHIWVL